MSKQNAEIIPCDDGFAVAVAGEIVRAGFVSRGHAAMWAARQRIYRGKTPRRAKPTIPPELEDQSIKSTRLLAAMIGQSHYRFMIDARAGKYGPLYRFGRGEGLMFGNWKRAMAARIVK
jgi:hypothetical protein